MKNQLYAFLAVAGLFGSGVDAQTVEWFAWPDPPPTAPSASGSNSLGSITASGGWGAINSAPGPSRPPGYYDFPDLAGTIAPNFVPTGGILNPKISPAA